MIGSAHHQLAALHRIIESIVDIHWVIHLTRHSIVVVVVVKHVDLRLQSSLAEGRGQMLQEGSLFFPGHIQAGTVATIERLVLRRHSIDIDAMLAESLDKLHEVLGIVAVVLRIQMAIRPMVVGLGGIQVLHLHPARAGPGRADDLHLGIDLEDFLQDGYQVILLVALQGEVPKSLRVAQRIDSAGEIAASDGHAAIADSKAPLRGKGLTQELMTVQRIHLHEIVATGIRESVSKTIHALELSCRHQADTVGTHRRRRFLNRALQGLCPIRRSGENPDVPGLGSQPKSHRKYNQILSHRKTYLTGNTYPLFYRVFNTISVISGVAPMRMGSVPPKPMLT